MKVQQESDRKMLKKGIEDMLEIKVYKKLLEEGNKIAIDYLFEIISLEWEYFYLEARYLERKNEYSKIKHKGTSAEKEIVSDYSIFLQNLIYRYYSLLQKFSQLINIVWVKEFREEDCNFNKVKNCTKTKEKFKFINQELKKIDTKSAKKILKERKHLVHRKIVKGEGSLFSSCILLLGGESAKEFLRWEKESNQVLEEVYGKTFKVIANILKVYIRDRG